VDFFALAICRVLAIQLHFGAIMAVLWALVLESALTSFDSGGKVRP
jgi:hypothetical protein